ncbi:MAG: hypothetical protein RPR97_01030 [Colwellia sp.]|jgi:hypothetical protein
MKKSKVIATCLINSGFISSIDEAEAAVYKIFKDSYSDHDFNSWNKFIDPDMGQNIIKTVGQASHINVERFIKDLW